MDGYVQNAAVDMAALRRRTTEMTDGATETPQSDQNGSAPFGPSNCSVRDWREDASHENGNYWNECLICHGMFLGHKRRTVCKACYTAASRTLRNNGAPNSASQSSPESSPGSSNRGCS